MDRYPNWAMEIKNLYDSYPDLHIVFTGSSILEIYKSNVDFSRRAIVYHLYGLSFREFLLLEYNYKATVISMSEILNNHAEISSKISSEIKIIPAFHAYLEYGYYSFFKEGTKLYSLRLRNVMNVILENDLPAIEKIEYSSIYKLRKMLMISGAVISDRGQPLLLKFNLLAPHHFPTAINHPYQMQSGIAFGVTNARIVGIP